MAEEAARDDLRRRLVELAAAENEAARQRAEALRRDIAEAIAKALPAVVEQDRSRGQLVPRAVEQRFDRELTELL